MEKVSEALDKYLRKDEDIKIDELGIDDAEKIKMLSMEHNISIESLIYLKKEIEIMFEEEYVEKYRDAVMDQIAAEEEAESEATNARYY